MEVIKENELIMFVIEKVAEGHSYLNIDVWRVEAWDLNNVPLDAEFYLSVQIKFDGTFDFVFGEGNGRISLEKDEFDRHCLLMKKIRDIGKTHFIKTHDWLWK